MPLLDPLDEHVKLETKSATINLQLIDLSSEADDSAASEPEVTTQQNVDPQKTKNEAQRAAFDDFLKHEVDHIGGTETTRTEIEKKVVDESARIIDRAREYQQELFERAKDENVIAVLDTGSGKTLIACLLIKHVLAQEDVRREKGEPPKLAFFLANSVHLVQQQARVLAANLVSAPVVLVGSDRVDGWKNRSFWASVLEQSTPVVCTPAMLQQCLDGAAIDITQIALLVFDEAHHAKKNHPYSRIVRSYYLACPLDERPKIFGMTASPVDSKGNIDTNAAELEQLLHSKIVTTSDLSILSFAPKPMDVIWRYPRPRRPFDTDLYLQLLPRCSFAAETKKAFEFAKKTVSELGSWCADRVWTFVFTNSEHESASMVKKFERGKVYADMQSNEQREDALQKLQEAAFIVVKHDFETPTPTFLHMSPKLIRLYEELKSRYWTDPETRSIVFVDQRLTALVLNDCFIKLNIPNVRSGTLLGTATDSLSSLKIQEQMLEHFRAGLINLVFATSVADEGIDIPQCNLCIRFDLYKTPIQYMQSRGRARMQGSTYVHMIQEDDQAQQYMVKYAVDSDRYIKDFCQSLPPDRLLGRGTKLDRMITRDSANRSFKTNTGVVCDFGNCLLILSRFTSSLHYIGAFDREIFEEEIDVDNKQFRYVVKLPPCEEIQVKGAKGDWRQNKQLAKRSAAFNCCYLLRRKGMLDQDLYSIYRKVKPDNLNAHLAVSDKKSSYPTLMKPSLWSQGLGDIPNSLFASIVTFNPEEPLRRQVSMLVMLTREPMPDFPSFPIYLEDNVRTLVAIVQIAQPFKVNSETVDKLTIFTLNGVFSDIFNKSYQLDGENMAYWLAPTLESFSTKSAVLSDLIDMAALEASVLGRIKWTAGTKVEGEWTNRFLCDPRNAKYHYFSGEIVKGATIYDPVPDTVPLISQKSSNNIIDFSDSTWKASKKNFARAAYDMEQPVVSADLLITRRNYLEKAIDMERVCIPCQIAPQPLEVSRLSPSFAAACFLWPTIIHRMESYMIVLEAFSQIGLEGISPSLALEAFTKDGDITDEESQTHFAAQRGMGKNYERLEFIGDSLLKMMTTITVFNRTKCDEEGMHCRRMEILCNRRLFDVSTQKLHLYKYARTSAFNSVTWYPENLVLIKGRGAKKEPELVRHPEIEQALGMKTIADISEAIIGAAVTASRGSPNQFDLGIKAISILVDSEDHAISSWAEIAPMYEAPDWSLLKNDIQANKLAKNIQARTGYEFQNPRLLRSAFTHSSDANATVPDLQRLEFLGDAVLDWVCISWLFYNNPDRNPQWLTEHKMAMVSNKFLAALAVVLDFDKFIYCSTTKLFADITEYAKKIREIRASPNVSRDFWTMIESPPKALSDLVESYLGALLVDSNWNYDEIEKFFNKHVLWFFQDISKYDTFANRHPTSFLYKKFYHEYKCRDFKIMSSEPMPNKNEFVITAGVLIHGQVITSSKGNSSKYAKVRVSKQALQLVEGMTPETFRKKYGCNCNVRPDQTSLILDRSVTRRSMIW